MNAQTKERCRVIAAEIKAEAFMATKAKNPREHFHRIDTLAREACDYFAFGFNAPPTPAPEPEPATFGFTCPIQDCWWNDIETEQPDYTSMREALDAADRHRLEHHAGQTGIVTHDSTNPRPPECCGKCPPLVRGGYDCTCAGNVSCPNYGTTQPTDPNVDHLNGSQ